MRRMPTTPSSEAIGRRPPGTGIVEENASSMKGTMGPVGSLKVQDLGLVGLIWLAFDASAASCVKRRNQPTASGTGRRRTETVRDPSRRPERGRHARGRSSSKAPNRSTIGASTRRLNSVSRRGIWWRLEPARPGQWPGRPHQIRDEGCCPRRSAAKARKRVARSSLSRRAPGRAPQCL